MTKIVSAPFISTVETLPSGGRRIKVVDPDGFIMTTVDGAELDYDGNADISDEARAEFMRLLYGNDDFRFYSAAFPDLNAKIPLE